MGKAFKVSLETIEGIKNYMTLPEEQRETVLVFIREHEQLWKEEYLNESLHAKHTTLFSEMCPDDRDVDEALETVSCFEDWSRNPERVLFGKGPGNPGVKMLDAIMPQLEPEEQELIGYIRLNTPTDEVASRFGISREALWKRKSRLIRKIRKLAT